MAAGEPETAQHIPDIPPPPSLLATAWFSWLSSIEFRHHSCAPSNAVPLYVTLPPPVITTHLEMIHVCPSPTGPNSYFLPDPHNNPSARSRSRSMRSSKRSQVSLQMIYTPPPPTPLSSQSQSAPVSPIGEGFQPTQPPPPIIAPSPVYRSPSPTLPWRRHPSHHKQFCQQA